MKMIMALGVAASFVAGSLTLTTTTASAAIVCNTDGDCWHTAQVYEYKPEFNLLVHPDDWKWKEGERHAWREHEGRGYWHGGDWKEF